MEQSWDPKVKRFFLKIINSIAWSLLWMMTCATTGLYFEMANTNKKPVMIPVLFYAGMLITLLLLIRYLYRSWR
jgi:hypothetical protein